MRAIFGLVLIVGMALAGAAVYMIQGYVSRTEALLAKEREFNGKAGKLVEVFLFAKDLEYGDELTEKDVKVSYWPEKALPKKIFRDKAELFPENADGPRYLLRDVDAFEPVLSSRVTEPGEIASLTAKLQPGMRAFTMKINMASGVASFVKPDDYVDVQWTGDFNGKLETWGIMSSIQIIAVDKAFNEGQSSGGTAKSITVAVTPEQAALLTQAQATGDLTMTLVGKNADVSTAEIKVNTNDVLGVEEKVKAPEAPKVEKKVCKRKERKGTEVVETTVPCPEE